MHGRSGIHTSKDDNDLLIIAAGYDHSRIVEWQPKRKDARKKVLLFGFPAISPGMFQENILRAHEAEAAIETECFKDMDSNIYAPAYDRIPIAQLIADHRIRVVALVSRDVRQTDIVVLIEQYNCNICVPYRNLCHICIVFFTANIL